MLDEYNNKENSGELFLYTEMLLHYYKKSMRYQAFQIEPYS